MNTNGHKTTRERLVTVLQQNNGELTLREVFFDYRFTRSQIDDVLENAHTPITIRLHWNGGTNPVTMLVLKGYEPPKAKTQAEISQTLNAMSPAEYRRWLEQVDPTYGLRHTRRAHSSRRTSTSADEYLFPQT
jgi:hypothetical protein